MEAILDHYAPEGKVRLVGYSMGGILSCLYAGIRPERVESVVTLDGFGIAPTTPKWRQSVIAPGWARSASRRACMSIPTARASPSD